MAARRALALASALLSTALAPLSSAAQESTAAAPGWSYSGPTGPDRWADLSPDYALCRSGRVQSPIDLSAAAASPSPDLDAILFAYQPGLASVVNDGHTVRWLSQKGGWMNVAGRRWNLVELHMHRPGESRFSGRPHEMEAHLVHRDENGALAVIAVLLDRGKENTFMRTLEAAMPRSTGGEGSIASLDFSDLLPAIRGYYTFPGSLTTPPCTENVTWYVMKRPVTLSGPQIAAFAELYPNNSRPVQAVNGREVRESR